MDNKQPVLSVRNLKQHFKSGFGKNKLVVKAVDGIDFDIYKGEVFGLVGESGCGKTTTGRSIIKLYEPTDGEVFFMGTRISGGIDGLKDAIRDRNEEYKFRTAELKTVLKEELEKASRNQTQAANAKAKYQEASQKLRLERARFISESRTEIALRKSDTHDFDRELMKNMQMIFQDPIASLNPRMTVKEIIAEGLRINAGNSSIYKKMRNIKATSKVEINALKREFKLDLKEAEFSGSDTTQLTREFEKKLRQIESHREELLTPLQKELEVRSNVDIKRQLSEAKQKGHCKN